MSIQVMIVDDEPIAAESVAYMIKKDFEAVEIAGIFYSGREAVQNAGLLRPDIAIMDIEMPGINGLEAMRQMKTQLPGIKFLILSAYDNFQYAVDALTVGASNYLLKPVKRKEFKTSFQKILDEIRIYKEEMVNALERQERIELIYPMLEQDFIHAFLPKANADERLLACASFLGNLNAIGYVVVLEVVSATGVLESLLHQLRSYMPVKAAEIGDNRIALYCMLESEKELSDHFKRFTAWCQLFLSKVSADPKTMFLLGSGNAYSGALSAKQSCREALLGLQLLQKRTSSSTDSNVVTISFDQIPKSERLELLEVEPVKQSADSLNEADKIVQRADQYIEDHYCEDVTLEDVARYVNLSPYYFSRFYKEYAGMNYIGKLISCRITKAKELLKQEEYSVKRAAYAVGYKDSSYFSKVFRKETGMTASEYRSMFLGGA